MLYLRSGVKDYKLIILQNRETIIKLIVIRNETKHIFISLLSCSSENFIILKVILWQRIEKYREVLLNHYYNGSELSIITRNFIIICSCF